MPRNVRKFHTSPEALWRVKFWYRDRYLSRDVHARHKGLANTFAFQALIREGYDPRILVNSHISTERIE